MAARPPCLCCGQSRARFYGIFSKKSELENVKDNIQLLFGHKLDFKKIPNSVICDHCLQIVTKLPKIKTRIADLYFSTTLTPEPKTKKRPPSTPASELRLKSTPTSREPVISSLVRSFQKLKTPSASGSETNRKERSGVSRRKIDFTDNDHCYSSISNFQFQDDNRSLMTSNAESILNENVDCEYESFCSEIQKQVTILANTKTFLLKNDVRMLQESDVFASCVVEMNSSCKGLLQVLINALGKHESVEKRIATIATIYGMILHSRNTKASGVQKLYSALLLRYHADNKLLQRLNSVHITLSASSKRNIVKDFGADLENKLVRGISEGKNGKLNGDNLDIRVNTNDIRMNNKNRDYHFFATNFVFNRVSIVKEPNLPRGSAEPNLELFIPNDNETNNYKQSLKILLGRILVEFMPGFEWLKKILPDHIEHQYKEEMKSKSEIHMLPLSLNNECSYDGCVRIMDEYVDMVNRWYRKAGRGGELDNLQIPVGGDQLTRVRFQGAKILRAGAHTKQERFDQLYPFVIELFHTLQDFLEKMCKRFLKVEKSRDQGTLANLKVLIQRSNVNGQVKSRFKAHEDFVLTVGHAYFLQYIMNKFNMKDMEDSPSHKSIPENIKLLHGKSKKAIFDEIMDEVIAEIFMPYESQGPRGVDLKVIIAGTIYVCKASVENNHVDVSFLLNGVNTLIKVPIEMIKEGCNVLVSGVNISIREYNKGQDDLYNYVYNFLQWYFIILQLQDAIHEGDMSRTNIVLKTMVPFFYSHSVLSKYFTECIDFILKTEFILPPHVSAEVRAASFVNVHGGIGKNKAADLHKENEVKLLKDLIRGLGANKTENSIIAISKAAPVISTVTENFDKMLGIMEFKTNHKKRSMKDDIGTIVKHLKTLNIWTYDGNRVLPSFHGITQSPFNFAPGLLNRSIQSTVFRLQRDLPCDQGEEEDVDEEGTED